MTLAGSLGRARRIQVVAFVLAFVVFCLAYLSGLALFVLGSLAMHGPRSWHQLRTASVVGSLAGGMVGLSACLLTRRVLTDAPKAARLIALPWISWVAFGVLATLLVDEEALDRSQALPFYVVRPGTMLVGTVSCVFVERLIVRRLGARSRAVHAQRLG